MSVLLQHLAHQLAEKQAINTILDACSVEVVNGVIWRDTTKLHNCSSVVWEVKYLHMRGKLERHPEVWNLVKLKDYDAQAPLETPTNTAR